MILKKVILSSLCVFLGGCSLVDTFDTQSNFDTSNTQSSKDSLYDTFHFKVENVEVIGKSSYWSGSTKLYTTNIRCTVTNDSSVSSTAYWELKYNYKFNGVEYDTLQTLAFDPCYLEAGESKICTFSYGDKPFELTTLSSIKRYEYYYSEDAFEVNNYLISREEKIDDYKYDYDFSLDVRNKTDSILDFSGKLIFRCESGTWYEDIYVYQINPSEVVTATMSFNTTEWSYCYGPVTSFSIYITNPTYVLIED